MDRPTWTDTRSQRVEPFVEEYPGFVVAHEGECREYQAKEVQLDTRNFTPLTPDELEGFDPPEAWYLGFVVCPEDDVVEVARFAAGIDDPYDRGRIGLYLAPDVDEERVLRDWLEAGASSPEVVQPFEDENDHWRSLHKHFGRDHAEQVDDDLRFRPDAVEAKAD